MFSPILEIFPFFNPSVRDREELKSSVCHLVIQLRALYAVDIWTVLLKSAVFSVDPGEAIVCSTNNVVIKCLFN